MLLVGAAVEIRSYWLSAAEAATLEERRRLARDLHDGLAQELAYITMQSRVLLKRRAADADIERVAVAAERALDEARRAIAMLTRPLHEPLAIVLEEIARDVADRVGVAAEVAVDETVDAPRETREALLRILRDAITIAARERQARTLRVILERRNGIRLRVTDDGMPAQSAAANASGSGLAAIRERVEAVGATVRVSPQAGGGTEVEVALP